MSARTRTAGEHDDRRGPGSFLTLARKRARGLTGRSHLAQCLVAASSRACVLLALVHGGAAYGAPDVIQAKIDAVRECVALFRKLDLKGDRRISREEAAPAPPIARAFEDPAVEARGYLMPKEFMSACLHAH